EPRRGGGVGRRRPGGWRCSSGVRTDARGRRGGGRRRGGRRVVDLSAAGRQGASARPAAARSGPVVGGISRAKIRAARSHAALALVDCVRGFDCNYCYMWLVSTLIGKRTQRGQSGQSTDRSAAGGSQSLRG